MPTTVVKSFYQHRWQIHKHCVGLGRVQEFDAGNFRQRAAETPGHFICVGGVPKPCAIAQQAHPRCGEETHFAGELAGLFVLPIEFACQ